MESADAVQTSFVTLPAHKFLHIKNYASNGFWDFWQKQNAIPGQDYETIRARLDAVPGKLDPDGGQIMAYISDPDGRMCAWGFPRTECYGVRLPADWAGDVPAHMFLLDVPETDYIVFAHKPFDYEQERESAEQAMENAMATYAFSGGGGYDISPGRIIYLYYTPGRTFTYVRPVRK